MSNRKIPFLGGEKTAPGHSPSQIGTKGNAGLFWDKISLFNARNFKIMTVTLFLFMIFMSRDYGINGDERFQVDYSKKLWNYYTSFGKETAALYIPEGQIHYYGGLFDFIAISLEKVIGLNNEFTLEYHMVRRILCSIFGFITIFFASLFARTIGGWPLAYITFIFMVLSPRFMGDAMVNPKDIPFAAGFIMGLYYIVIFIRCFPRPTMASMIGIIIGSMIAFGTRAGGMLLIVYLFLFAGMYLTKKALSKTAISNSQLWNCIKYTLITGFLAYLAGILFWPYALSDPWANPFKALAEFSNQPIAFPVLFKGQHILNTMLPFYYLPEWIIRTIPVSVILGLFFFLRRFHLRTIPFLESGMLLFSILFPITYAMYKGSSLHDGWRHFIFVYPSIVIVAATGWFLWLKSLKSTSSLKLYLVILLFLLSENIYSIFTLHPYQYTYFNPLFGGLKKAYGKFETDYWMLSIKEASSWLMQNEPLGIDGKPSIVATNCMYPATVYLNDSAKGIKTKYVRYYERSEHQWDYALFYSRFVDRWQLQNQIWPPKGTIHTINTNGIPLCAIVKRENKEDYLGFEAAAINDVGCAIEHFTKALEYDPNNEKVALALSIIYYKSGQLDLADKALNQSLKAYPDNPAAQTVLNSLLIGKEKSQ